jgi:tetratricopeptide (TPR) repeat protein
MLGLAYQMTGRFPEAESAFQHSLSILKRDAENVSDYASALDNYAGLYFEAGRLVEAAAMRRKALDLQLRTGDHAAATRSLTNLAGVALAQKRLRESKEYLKKAFDQMALAPDLIEADFALFFETEACLALAEGHPAAAVADYQRALELTRRTHGDHHWLAGYEHMLLGKAYAQSGNIAWALAEMRLGLEILDSTLDRRNPKYFAAEIAYSDVLDRAGFHAKAAQLRTTAQRASKDFYRGQCVGCTINVAAFR